MRKNIVIFGLFLMELAFLNAQYVVNNATELVQLKELPLEKMYVHHNSSVLMPGEYMYYSLYCINTATNKLSRTSRMAYIELVGEDYESKLIQKVRLDKGRGQGDFFIPVSLPSGNYKLLAYTQWMKNAGVKQLYQDDLTIINPYRSDQEAIRATSADSTTVSRTQNTKSSDFKNEGVLVLETDKKTYQKREKINLIPRNYKGPLGYGSYIDFSNAYLNASKRISKTVSDSIYLPEQRGELFFGRVNAKEEGLSEAGKTVVVSVPGEDFELKSAITNQDGVFYTYLQKEYSATELLAQLLDEQREKYDVHFLSASALSYEGLTFNTYTLDSRHEQALVDRSVHNQIENGYYSVKPDSILAIPKKDPFDGGVIEKIVLAEYTRFKTLRETLIEIVNNVWVKKLDDGSYTFWVEEDLGAFDENYAVDPPLVLIDGIFIPDHTNLLEFNARTIKTMNILRDPLVMGSKRYNGMVAMETNEGNYLELYNNKAMDKMALELPVPKKNYFQQQYGEVKDVEYERIPDFRYQLLWEPNVTIQDSQPTLEFFASDIPGEYEIVLEGFTTYGKPISVRESFTVE